MYAFSVHKKMDYSIPILFSPAYAPSAAKSFGGHGKATAGAALKEQSKTTATIASKVIPSKIAIPKAIEKPIKNESEKATTIAAPPKKDMAKKKDIAEPVKKVVPVETIKPVIEKKEPAPAIAKPTPAGVPIRNVMEDGIKNAHISNNYREVEALRRGAQLQKELVQKWQPPVGVSPDCSCDISFFVSKEGTIQNLKMVKSSGIIMFDISARQALCAMKMPQWTYGKPLTINFK